jgi:hypothetical protein
MRTHLWCISGRLWRRRACADRREEPVVGLDELAELLSRAANIKEDNGSGHGSQTPTGAIGYIAGNLTFWLR